MEKINISVDSVTRAKFEYVVLLFSQFVIIMFWRKEKTNYIITAF